MIGERESIHQEVLRLALPAVGEHLIRFSGGIVDTFLVGHLGSTALAVFGLSNQFFVLSAVIIAPLIVGCGVMTAQYFGAEKPSQAHQILAQGIWMAVVSSIAMLVVGFTFAEQSLTLLGAERAVAVQGASFLRLIVCSIPLHTSIFVINASLRGAGDTRTPMLVMILWAMVQIPTAFFLVNNPLSPLYLRANGVAVAGLIARSLSLLLLLIWLASGRLKLNLSAIPLRIDLPTSKSILELGIPSGFEQLALRMGQTVNIRVIATLGTVNYAAYLIGFNTLSIALVVGIGFTMAATTIVGQWIGAGEPIVAHSGARHVWITAMVSMGCIGVTYILWAPQIIGIFTDDEQVITLATLPLQLVSLILPFEATNQILSGAFRGAGNTRWPMLVTAGGNWLVRFPLTLALTAPLGLLGAWLAVMTEIIMRALTHMRRFRQKSWLDMIRPQLKGAIR